VVEDEVEEVAAAAVVGAEAEVRDLGEGAVLDVAAEGEEGVLATAAIKPIDRRPRCTWSYKSLGSTDSLRTRSGPSLK